MTPFRTVRAFQFLSLLAFAGSWLTSPAFAEAQGKAGIGAAVENDDAAILPYLDEGTFIVGRLQIDKVDPDALGKYMETVFESMLGTTPIPEAQVARVRENMLQSVVSAKSWLADMDAAGAKRLYVLFDSADQIGPRDSGPVVVVPLAEGVDSAKVQEILLRAGGRMQATEIGKAVVFAEAEPIERLKTRIEMNAAPAERPDLARAMAAAGDAPMRVTLVPGESSRKWVEENLPQLPAALGGGETKLISRGIRYATLSAVQKPETQATVKVVAADAATATALLDVLEKGKAFVTQAMAANPGAGDVAKRIGELQPKATGDTVTFSADPALFMVGIRGVAMQAAPRNAPGQPAALPPGKADDGGL